jgi:predicted dehydrogenase
LRRREFLATSSAVLGANDRIRIGIIGAGGRGQYLSGFLRQLAGVEIAAVCDVYETNARLARQQAGGTPEIFTDHRRLLARKDIDAVVIAPPDHWHAPILIDAVQAAKDAYVEKPMTHNAAEGVAVVKAVRASGRIVQVGVQRRSCPSFHEAKSKYIDSGRIGKITAVRCVWDGNGWFRRGVPGGGEAQPADLDWERFLGPAPKRPWDALRYYNWGAYRDYSTGQPGGVFSHLIDVAHWFTGDDQPLHAVASGGVYWLRDGRDVPDTLSVIYEYGKGHAVTAQATLASRNTSRTEFFGTGGTLLMRHRLYSFTPIDSKVAVEEAPVLPQPMEPPHILNWIECLRSRKAPHADVSTGHFTAVACHMGNLANERKTIVYWNKEWNL